MTEDEERIEEARRRDEKAREVWGPHGLKPAVPEERKDKHDSAGACA
jgi:hypothetical protein